MNLAATPWLNLIGFGVYAAVILGCVIVVLRENRNPIRSLAWVLSLIFLPGVGLIFYMFFGRSLKGIHLISKQSRRKLLTRVAANRASFDQAELTADERVLSRLADNLCNSPLTVNNSVEIFTDGATKFHSLIDDLKGARKSIFLQYYIFSDDNIGNTIAGILIEKAQAGVAVRVIYDNVGSFSTSRKFFRRMSEAGVEIHPFFRVTFPQLANRINWRNHRKLVIIDNRIGYIGGMNIADRYACSESEGIVWRDTHFRLRGDIVESLMLSFAIDWFFLNNGVARLPLEFMHEEISNKTGMQLVTSGPVNTWDNLSLVFLRAITSATKSIYIQTPYFLPTDALIHALEAAALGGVDVRIMLPGKCDSRLLQYASYSYVTQCLKAGIKVYFYDPGMLHSKMMVIDHGLATVGSTNFDFRSFENNFECNLLVYDAEFNSRCRDIFFNDLSQCSKLTLSSWHKRPLFNRLIESIVRLLSPVL
ncbi:MAG: cardiolipin synthase [Clostridium sp.]|nr:cardiolipin synthase [Prevotella sp.]MCM1428341.1 cardiolipin synthase [Clostridium sp.]MCM1474813.1 cardiolipin synthase [Muribaculaceae bacterium]